MPSVKGSFPDLFYTILFHDRLPPFPSDSCLHCRVLLVRLQTPMRGHQTILITCSATPLFTTTTWQTSRAKRLRLHPCHRPRRLSYNPLSRHLDDISRTCTVKACFRVLSITTLASRPRHHARAVSGRLSRLNLVVAHAAVLRLVASAQ